MDKQSNQVIPHKNKETGNSREQFLMPARDMYEIEQPVPETPQQRKNYLLRTRPPWIALLLCFIFSLVRNPS